MRASIRSEAGFTLVEAIVALLLLGLALVPILGTLTSGLRAEARLEAHRDAVALADARMSELSLLPVDSLVGYLQPRGGMFPPPFAGYRWSALMRPTAESPAVVQAAVRVEWEGGEYSLETFFHRPEMVPDRLPSVDTTAAPGDSAGLLQPGNRE